MSQKLPVVFFSNSQERGGAEEHMLTLLKGFSRDNFSFHLVCPPVVARAVERDLPKDVELREINLCSPKHVGAGLDLLNYLRKVKPAILHSHLFFASFFASPIGKLAGIQVVIETPHVREQWRKGWKANYRIDRVSGRFVDHYIAVSAANKKYLVEEKGLPADKISVILNGSDLRKFYKYVPSKDLRAQLGIGIDDPVVVVPARLAPQKGHTYLLDAAPSIVKEFPRVQFLCLGDGDLKSELMAKAENLGVARNFRWLGFQQDMPEWYALADVVALPSLFEGLPLSMIEALASGRAAVATAVDGTPEIVVNERTGLLVEPGNPQELSTAIRRLLADTSLRHRLGDMGAQWVTDHFSDLRQIRATEELYLQLFGGRKVIRSANESRGEEREAATLTRS